MNPPIQNQQHSYKMYDLNVNMYAKPILVPTQYPYNAYLAQPI